MIKLRIGDLVKVANMLPPVGIVVESIDDQIDDFQYCLEKDLTVCFKIKDQDYVYSYVLKDVQLDLEYIRLQRRDIHLWKIIAGTSIKLLVTLTNPYVKYEANIFILSRISDVV